MAAQRHDRALGVRQPLEVMRRGAAIVCHSMRVIYEKNIPYTKLEGFVNPTSVVGSQLLR